MIHTKENSLNPPPIMQKGISQTSLLFNIIYIPGMTKYVEPFVSSLLNSTHCQYRLISNGCSREEQLILEKYCSEHPRLEYLQLSSEKIYTHCKALTKLQEMEESEYFCFMDADIFSQGDFLQDFLPYLDKYSGVFSGYPIWCDSKYQVIPEDWPDMGGRHTVTSEGVCLGGSYFAIYDNRLLTEFIKSTGITFSRYTWQEIPSTYQKKLITLGLKKNTYDTGKVLNVLFQSQGNPLVFVESNRLFHLGAMRLFSNGNASHLFSGNIPRLLAAPKKYSQSFIDSIKLFVKKKLGINQFLLSEEQNKEYKKILETREIVSNYFLDLLTSVSNKKPFNKEIDVSSKEVERRVKLGAEGIKSIWNEGGYQSKKGSFGASILLLLGSTLFGFLLVEIIFRFYLFGVNSFSIEKVNSTQNLGVSGLISPAKSPELIYEIKPNLKTIFKLVPFETNSKGLRDKEYSLTAPDKTFRVAVIGDSLTMGSGVNIDETYHSLLEDRLNKGQREKRFEFINFGVGGYTLRQYLGSLNYKVKSYSPDLILIGFYPGNDLDIISDKKFKEAYIVKNRQYKFFSSFVLKELHKLAVSLLRAKPQQTTKEKIQYMSEIFSQFANFSQNQNVPIVVVYLTARTDHKHTVPTDLIERVSKDHGLYFVDVSKGFKNQNIREYAIYPSDLHPNAKANKIFSTNIYDFLLSTSLLK